VELQAVTAIFMSPDDLTNRRDYFRIDTVLPFVYCLREEPRLPEPSRAKLNLGLGGISFATNRRFKLDDMLLIAIALPSPPVLHAVGRVVRIAPGMGDGSELIVRVRFTNLSLNNKDRLHNYIVAVEREGLRPQDEG
jgi:c-di-GMP-binding flagellar brake protein YcgR